ncbi:MAG: threonine/serine exporter family protein [Gemmatimonadaceae bacterium]|nr:threonine/serine exporter family protein [Gemmatimonadaceae bacterium]
MPVTPLPVDTAQHLNAHFILHLAKALHAHGYSAHRLEEALGHVSARLGLEAQFFTTPTSIFAGFGPPDAQRTHLMRVQPGEPNLGHLSRLDGIMSDVVDGRITASEGSVRIGQLLAEPPRWSGAQTIIAFVLASAGVSCFFGVTIFEACVASVLGLVAGLCALTAGRVRGLAPVLEPFTAAMVATLAFLVAGITGGGNAYQTTLAGLIVLLPGLTFTIGLTELSTRHLASGTARLSGALVTFLGLGFGVALGAKAGTLMADAIVRTGVEWVVMAPRVPWWTEVIAVITAPLCFAVLLRADRRDVWWMSRDG